MIRSIIIWSVVALAILQVANVQGIGNSAPAHPTAANCTWQWFTQPIDHFARGSVSGVGSTYKQRVCLYDRYYREFDSNSPRIDQRPMFFYVGNEATVEAYVNNTGLMWDLAPKYGALIVFAEHRYFGESVPDLKSTPNCLAYLSSAQALADYAMVVQGLKDQYGMTASNKVTSFGGSYGGMLAAWFRFKYPHVNSGGAIAASAPVVGFPGNRPRLDGGWTAISRTALHRYDARTGGPACHSAVLATWPLMQQLGTTPWGRSALRTAMATCEPVRNQEDAKALLDYVQQVFFLLAEGNFPFPTNYITFAILETLAPMPAWPVAHVCRKMQAAADRHRLSVSGDPADVRFRVEVGAPALAVELDWQTASSDIDRRDLADGGVQAAIGMVEAMRGAIDVFYNVTQKLECHSYRTNYLQTAGRFTGPAARQQVNVEAVQQQVKVGAAMPQVLKRKLQEEDTAMCQHDEIDPLVAWSAIVCNEDQNTVNYSIRGAGRDMFWPPTTASRSYSQKDVVPGTLAYCKTFAADNPGYTGVFPDADDYARWPMQLYGGNETYQPPAHVKPAASRIAFSNGLFDPWSAAGVMPADGQTSQVDAQGISKLVVTDGGHHADLFFPTEFDTPSMKKVREQEEYLIEQWSYHVDEE